ncbi:response regulator transcription factor [Pontiella agarivorans]|uniref:response regulator transcription factor n=1 Tax=Pontiella agarivorans TaxID=3038953 RepID=UPI003D67C8C5
MLSPLTRRQYQVAELLTTGKSNREIAEVLRISPRTVGKYLEQIYTNLGVHSRTALAAVWGRGLVQSDQPLCQQPGAE